MLDIEFALRSPTHFYAFVKYDRNRDPCWVFRRNVQSKREICGHPYVLTTIEEVGIPFTRNGLETGLDNLDRYRDRDPRVEVIVFPVEYRDYKTKELYYEIMGMFDGIEYTYNKPWKIRAVDNEQEYHAKYGDMDAKNIREHSIIELSRIFDANVVISSQPTI